MKKIFESSTDTLDTPTLIGTDEEKIAGIKFWAELVSLVRSVNSVFVSYENKQEVIKYLKKEIEQIDVEINNISASVVSHPDEIPSAEQVPKDEAVPEIPEVDLSKNDEVANTTNQSVPAKPQEDNPVIKPAEPKQDNIDKMRRLAGTGQYSKEYVVPESKGGSANTKLTFSDLDKLRRVAGSGTWSKK